MFTTGGLGRAYLVTVLAAAGNVPVMLLVTGGAAFSLTRKRFRVPIIVYYLVTIYFTGVDSDSMSVSHSG